MPDLQADQNGKWWKSGERGKRVTEVGRSDGMGNERNEHNISFIIYMYIKVFRGYKVGSVNSEMLITLLKKC